MTPLHNRRKENMKCSIPFGLILCVSLCLSPASAAAEESALKVGATLENLQAAFNGESNAHVRYLAFAEKADQDGYQQVASLFRAAAKSEDIHAGNHKKVIEKLGGQVKADITKPDVKTTKENLEAAIKGESYERDVMYPAFIKKAEEENLSNAVRTFKWATGAETEHTKLYSQAHDNLDSWKNGKKLFVVCPQCGNTLPTGDFTKCPVCAEPRKKFLDVN
jgi:rubrerythrin